MTHIHKDNHKPAQFLIENIELLPKGRVLDLAMGSGRNTIYLAQQGFDVEGVDISPEVVSTALELAQKANVAIRVKITDLEGNYRIEQAAYDVIICFNYLQRSLITQIKDGLREGGVVVYETFIVDQVQFGEPHNPDYLLKYNELLKMFHDFRCLRYREGIIAGTQAIASILAQKVPPGIISQ
jgi:SAM-dependent methyltransferase